MYVLEASIETRWVLSILQFRELARNTLVTRNAKISQQTEQISGTVATSELLPKAFVITERDSIPVRYCSVRVRDSQIIQQLHAWLDSPSMAADAFRSNESVQQLHV
jgi:hypothetical protein